MNKKIVLSSSKIIFGLFGLTLTASAMADSRPIYTEDQEDQFIETYSPKYDIPKRFIKGNLK